jgi:hypothetical protein
VIERVRRDDPVAYMRTVAILVRGVPNADLVEQSLAHLSDDELKAEMLAGFCKVFPELRVVRRPATCKKTAKRGWPLFSVKFKSTAMRGISLARATKGLHHQDPQ